MVIAANAPELVLSEMVLLSILTIEGDALDSTAGPPPVLPVIVTFVRLSVSPPWMCMAPAAVGASLWLTVTLVSEFVVAALRKIPPPAPVVESFQLMMLLVAVSAPQLAMPPPLPVAVFSVSLTRSRLSVPLLPTSVPLGSPARDGWSCCR